MQKFILRERTILILFVLAPAIRIFSNYPNLVEAYYSTGAYPPVSAFLRLLFGWIPFSIGDLFYMAVFIYLVFKAIKLLFHWRNLRWQNALAWPGIRKLLLIVLWIYMAFNLLWGLNYNRQGIASQLQLKVQPYSVQDLAILTRVLQQRLNNYAAKVDSLERIGLNKNAMLFQEGVKSYKKAKDSFPFLTYAHPSIKPSMISHIGQYFGFTGYYNPFSGEAQLKTTVPVFLKPFIVTHEMAHQLGYGKENEANFVGYLACKSASNVNFRYSVYFELSLYALSDLRTRDSVQVKQLKLEWSNRVKYDYHDFIHYLEESENSIEPVIMRFYDQYLKMNSQPKGNKTYNEVIAWLIAYMKKYGQEAL